jgi:V8-like Glu-specific endopeptidase
MLVSPCAILDVEEDDGLLLHDCDASWGDSGSPVLIQRDGAWTVVAVQVGVRRDGGGEMPFAALIDRRMLLQADEPALTPPQNAETESRK